VETHDSRYTYTIAYGCRFFNKLPLALIGMFIVSNYKLMHLVTNKCVIDLSSILIGTYSNFAVLTFINKSELK